jgi:trk system potassium uptake protein TrkA
VFVVVLGGGKVGANLTRTLLGLGHEVVIVEQDRRRYDELAVELGHRAVHGDASEIYVLERAGIRRPPDIVVAATGDDEDNIVICQLAKERYGVPKVIARVNDPRNQSHFDLLDLAPTVSATSTIMALIEHEVPEHELVHLLELRRENLEIVEVEIGASAPAVGKRVEDLKLPESSRLISVMRDGKAEIAVGATVLRGGDQVIAILQPGAEDDLCRVLLEPSRRSGGLRSAFTRA